MAAQVRAMLPQFCGISGSTRTIFSMERCNTFLNASYILNQNCTKFNNNSSEICEFHPESIKNLRKSEKWRIIQPGFFQFMDENLVFGTKSW